MGSKGQGPGGLACERAERRWRGERVCPGERERKGELGVVIDRGGGLVEGPWKT
jgi:hypothetical protein